MLTALTLIFKATINPNEQKRDLAQLLLLCNELEAYGSPYIYKVSDGDNDIIHNWYKYHKIEVCISYYKGNKTRTLYHHSFPFMSRLLDERGTHYSNHLVRDKFRNKINNWRKHMKENYVQHIAA
ncbi:hypothetical protein [Vibrio owensii]|uniref:hypothetical protein n=1 Tax=Vibrio owensii TaxID=696485 RepID=UPI003CC68B7C